MWSGENDTSELNWYWEGMSFFFGNKAAGRLEPMYYEGFLNFNFV